MGTQPVAESQLVVIGSSAGGIEALSRVVASLPADFPAPIVIAQHLDPRRPSHLGEILARHATLPIRIVDDTAALEDGVIFVVPSNRLVEIVNGELRLRPAKPGKIAPSVDLLLETAAAAFGPGLTAVILTGSGSDGSAGAWHVKQAGGAVVIENPATALFPSMPRSISPSLVDATAELDSMGEVLREMLAAGGGVPDERDGRDFDALLDRIRERSGIDFSTYKTATIIRRLRGRMGATGHTSLAEYAKQLATNEELETLNEELTASVEELRVANEDLATRTEDLRLQTVALAEQKQHGEEEHNRLESVLASLGDAVVAVDHAGQTLATNPAYDRLFGGPDAVIQPEDLAGLPLPPEEWPQRRAASGERFRMEFAVSEPDGTRRWLEAVTEPLTSEDRTWGGVVAIRDVSERTMRLSLERLMAAAGHELKTPTAAIHNYLQLVDRHLAEGHLEVAGTYTTRALAQIRRLASLIERLLDVSRIQSGQLELLVDVVDLAALVRSAVEIAEVLPKAPPIRVKAGGEPVPVRADPDRLEQVLLNLLVNAMEHAPGSGPIDVTVKGSDGLAQVTVRDHGPGVKAEDIRTMFDAYTRLGHPHRAPGLGLGLYVAREIVTAHNGEIEATSRWGKGTVMTVRLPLADRRTPRGRGRSTG